MSAERAARNRLISSFRNRLQEGQRAICERFLTTGNALALLHERCRLIDDTLCDLCQAVNLPASLAVLAVGGYGRGELYPASDVDLLILLPEQADDALTAQLEGLVCLFWDIGLEIGHSVRTIEECLEQASGNITVQTSMIEARLLAGSASLFAGFSVRIKAALDAKNFFQTKRIEQEDRHQRFGETPYSLEANCKEGPGGLRDLQLILWTTQAAGYGNCWKDLERRGFITIDEKQLLESSEAFLRDLRTRLHLLAGRREDRLLFEYQTALAEQLGITATATQRASEQLMQRYYRRAKAVLQINAILLQNIGTALVPPREEPPQPINERFQNAHELLDVVHEDVFDVTPGAILEAFLLLQQHAGLHGMTARAQRALWRARTLIDDDFRRNPTNRRHFLELFTYGNRLTQALRRMNQLGVLGRYLPNFGRVVGQMQHDLFHVYTVDQHILQVLRRLRRFAIEEFAHEYPLCSRLISDFGNPWVLYIAALFHDIGKGRGGDHSELGAIDAAQFCADHDLAADESELVVWLVRQHLLMSRSAQKEDISDPTVIARFAEIIGDERHLVALYLLTVADIRGTSPKVWNAWKGQLLEQLFTATRRHLRSSEAPPMPAGVIAQRQEEARRVMRFLALPETIHERLWEQVDTVYFLRQSAEEIAWHARVLHDRRKTDTPLVKARLSPLATGLEVMVYAHDQADLFVRIVGFFSSADYSIVDAKIHTTSDGYALDTFVLLDVTNRHSEREMISYIEHELSQRLSRHSAGEAPASGRVSRQVRHFPLQPLVSIQPLVSLEADETGKMFVLTVVAADRPGLLFTIATQLAAHRANLHTAKIVTLGERVEDTFLISGGHLEESACRVKLEADLLKQLQL
ncbi:[protein-PII] uridylyltransferase [Candidatus Accumulibacter phosphatis]|uniref:Bifunctional uridylyltransferase/uridylyl-removing enzyme n=1 Tax=Candidatus Accumulibacter phosphatis TaxID=327160 RepID=A0ABX1TWC4_9PROT|nr:[protein-PII] uridylyltransferase [Candidatus Accumulibacter phosphatis]NMQ27755.1 [protein-PII] uridylyltransferase [Candidatus Accumulibacter phosphatis]